MKDQLKALALKALKNLKYPSTLQGITILAGVVGVQLAPELLEAIATAVVALVGVINLLMSDADVKND